MHSRTRAARSPQRGKGERLMPRIYIPPFRICGVLFTQRGTKGFRSNSDQLSVTLSGGTPLSPYGVAYHRGYGLIGTGLFKRSQ